MVFLSPAWADESAVKLTQDKATTVQRIEVVCTGVGSTNRSNPKWANYPLKVEVVGKKGQYLGGTIVKLRDRNGEVVAVTCDGPWILFEAMPGRYTVMATVGGESRSSIAFVPEKGQGRIILRFPDLGGVVSQHADQSIS